MDRDLSEETCLQHPQVYESGRKNMYLSVRKMAQWICHAIIHGLIIFFIPLFAFLYGAAWSPDGKSDGLYVAGLAIYTCMIFAMHWKVRHFKIIECEPQLFLT